MPILSGALLGKERPQATDLPRNFCNRFSQKIAHSEKNRYLCGEFMTKAALVSPDLFLITHYSECPETEAITGSNVATTVG